MTTSLESRLSALTTEQLDPLVRRLLSNDTLVIAAWQYEEMQGGGGATYFGVAGLFRLRGTVTGASGRSDTWSLVLKCFDGTKPGASQDSHSWNYWKRETLAYQSQLLKQLPSGLQAARCLDVWEHTPTDVWIWLEDVPGADNQWTLDDYGRAARQLGMFNGGSILSGQTYDEPWLSRSQVVEWHPHGVDFASRTRNYADSDIAKSMLLPGDLERTLDLWRGHKVLMEAYSRLQLCLCHQDAHRQNLMLSNSGQSLTAVDWAMLGLSAVGSEAGTMMAISLRYTHFQPQQAKALDATVFENYLDGLRSAGWQGERHTVRLAYVIDAFVISGVTWLLGNLEGMQQPEYAQAFSEGLPLSEVLEHAAIGQHYLLELGEEAFRLL